jgi:hypothetical protein
VSLRGASECVLMLYLRYVAYAVDDTTVIHDDRIVPLVMVVFVVDTRPC